MEPPKTPPLNAVSHPNMSENASQIQTFQKPGQLNLFLKKYRGSIASALPKHLNPDRMLRLAVTSFSMNPNLRECSAESIIASVIVASQLGLEIGVAGQGWLVPYKGVCTFIPGWQGLAGLVNNTGRATVWTGCVYEGDDFTYRQGSRPACDIVPGENTGIEEKIIYFFACGKVNGSEQPVIEVWSNERMIRHRNKFNKQGNKHYSFKNWEMYGRKVVLLQVLKYMPRSIELNNALVAAEAAEKGHTSRVEEDGVVIEVPAIEDAPSEPVFEEVTAGEERKPVETVPEKPAVDVVVKKVAKKENGEVADIYLWIAFEEKRVAAGINEQELTVWAHRTGTVPQGEAFATISLRKLRHVLDNFDQVVNQIITARNTTQAHS